MERLFFSFVLDSIDTARRTSIHRLLERNRPEAIAELEAWFEHALPGRRAVAVGSGRFGLAALVEHLACECGQGRANVIIPGFSCVVVSNAVRAAHCEVRYADIAPETLNVSLDTVRRLVDENTVAIVVQHILGLTDRAAVEQLKESFPSVSIIEDCAHALGGRYSDGKFVGAAGDFAFYSFEQSKMVTAWTGGVVVGRAGMAIDAVRAAHQKCRPAGLKNDLCLFAKLASHYWGYRKRAGWSGRLGVRIVDRLLRFEPGIDIDERRGLFTPYRLTRFSAGQAACVLDQLRLIEGNVAHRRTLSDVYASMLASPFAVCEGAAVLRYPLWVSNKRAFIKGCTSRGVAVGNWFSTPVHPSDPGIEALAYRPGSCPRAEAMARHIVNLPTALQINVNDARRIAGIALSVEPTLAKERAAHV